MKKPIFISFIGLLFCLTSAGQVSQDRSAVRLLRSFDKHIGSKLDNCRYFFYGLAPETYLVIANENGIYKEYFFFDNKLHVRDERIKGRKKAREKLFEKNSYTREYTDLNSDMYRSEQALSNGVPAYLFFHDSDGIIYGESMVSFIISPPPVDVDVFRYVTDRFIRNLKMEMTDM